MSFDTFADDYVGRCASHVLIHKVRRSNLVFRSEEESSFEHREAFAFTALRFARLSRAWSRRSCSNVAVPFFTVSFQTSLFCDRSRQPSVGMRKASKSRLQVSLYSFKGQSSGRDP